LKPYVQRVLANYVLLESTLRLLGQKGDELRRAVREDRDRRAAELVLDWKAPAEPQRSVEVQGVEWRTSPSALSGGTRIEYTATPKTWNAPKLDATVPAATARRPRAYWIPPTWSDVIERLELQGLRVERQPQARRVDVEMYRIRQPKLSSQPFEGRVGVTARFEPEHRAETFPPGSVRVLTDQPLGDFLMLLLEPASPDSYFAWGFFHEVLQPTEMVESYVMEPMAERMLAEDPALRSSFEKWKQDAASRAATPRARGEDEAFQQGVAAPLQWLYERTPFFDERAFLYPIARELQ